MLASAWLSYCGYLRSIPSGSAVRSSWAGYGRYNRTRFSMRVNHLAQEITFLDCLDSAPRGRKAHDPRDMIFAFLAHPDANPFAPDYHRDAAAAYQRFAASCLEAHRNPSMLSYAARSAEPTQLAPEMDQAVPSWCPVWNDPESSPFPLGLNRSSTYAPAGDTAFEHSVSEGSNGNHVTAKGEPMLDARVQRDLVGVARVLEDALARVALLRREDGVGLGSGDGQQAGDGGELVPLDEGRVDEVADVTPET